jgi:group I intron endonuclease
MKRKLISGIYQITNMLDGKCYIGQSKDINLRWIRHKNSNGSLLLGNAIKKYGVINFKLEVLEIVPNIGIEKDFRNKLTEREQYYLELKKPYLKENGYNIEKVAGYNSSSVRDDAFKKNVSKRNLEGLYCTKKVNQYNLNGELIKTWDSAAKIERELGYKAENISSCCLKKQNQSNKFIWCFYEDKIEKEDIERINNSQRLSEVRQYDLDGNLINTFENTLEAEKNTGISSKIIRSTCRGETKTGGNFIWLYKGKKLNLNNHKHKDTKIYQFNLSGELIKIWLSINEINKTNGFSKTGLISHLNNKKDNYKGFIWKKS